MIKINAEVANYLMGKDAEFASFIWEANKKDAQAASWERNLYSPVYLDKETAASKMRQRRKDAAWNLLRARRIAIDDWGITDLFEGYVNLQSPESCEEASEAVRFFCECELNVKVVEYSYEDFLNRVAV